MKRPRVASQLLIHSGIFEVAESEYDNRFSELLVNLVLNVMKTALR
jgi:hypothetical protein